MDVKDHEEEALSLLKLSLSKDVGNALIFSLVEHFGSASAALQASRRELQQVKGISGAISSSIAQGPDPAALDTELGLLEKHRVRLVPYFFDDYPPPLRYLEGDMPVLLRVKGDYLERDQLAVAVVGCRRCTHYGRRQAERLATRLAGMGLTVVSGLARGIDSAAHRAALQANGRTLAVIGSGLANIYPPEHAELADEIARNGALLSELPMLFEAHAGNFPPRNRIISALSLGVVVVEAARRSGSLITARLAAEQGKTVLAVPGNIDSPASYGANKLIQDGAVLVQTAEDVVESLGPLAEPLLLAGSDGEDTGAVRVADARVMALNEREREIFQLLSHTPKHIDAVIEESGLPPSIVSSTLLTLEIKGTVLQLAGQRYVRN